MGASYFRQRVNGDYDNGVCGDCNAIVCNLVTLFGSDCVDGLNAVLKVQHTEVPNLGASWSYFDGLNAVIGVQLTEVPNLGAS